MVGQTTERIFPKDIEALKADFHRRLVEAKAKRAKIGEQMLALEKEFSAVEAEEMTWDTALYTLENVGVQTGPKKRNKSKNEEEEEEGED